MARKINVLKDNISIEKHGDLDSGDQVIVSDDTYQQLLATGRFSDGTLSDLGDASPTAGQSSSVYLPSPADNRLDLTWEIDPTTKKLRAPYPSSLGTPEVPSPLAWAVEVVGTSVRFRQSMLAIASSAYSLAFTTATPFSQHAEVVIGYESAEHGPLWLELLHLKGSGSGGGSLPGGITSGGLEAYGSTTVNMQYVFKAGDSLSVRTDDFGALLSIAEGSGVILTLEALIVADDAEFTPPTS